MNGTRGPLTAVLAMLAALTMAAPASAAPEDAYERLRIASELEYRCGKLAWLEQNWLNVAGNEAFDRSSAKAAFDKAADRAAERKRHREGIVQRAGQLDCSGEGERYLLDGLQAAWVSAGVRFAFVTQRARLAAQGKPALDLTPEERQLAELFGGLLRRRFGQQLQAFEQQVGQRLQAMAAERPEGTLSVYEMLYGSGQLLDDVRFMRAIEGPGYVAREVPLGDGSATTQLSPPDGAAPKAAADAGGLPRAVLVSDVSRFNIRVDRDKWVEAHGFVSLGADDALYVVAIAPDAATLPATVRAVLDADKGPPVEGTRVTGPCPGTLCFRFPRSGYDRQAKLAGVLQHRAFITARPENQLTKDKREAISAFLTRIEEARRKLATP